MAALDTASAHPSVDRVGATVALSTGYRPDIDGLRAIAVLSVVAYHAFSHSVPGGFTGVDVFFVISGFLISGIIFGDLRRRRFSYRSFYARRFRRIFPALALVLGTSLLYGWFALAPDEYRELGRQAAASAGFGANILFWRESGYFDASAAVKPLLHLWSLGIEEQFYLLWPAVIVLTFARRAWLPVVALAIIVSTFVTNLALTATDSPAAFFLPLARFWELLLGAMLAYWVARRVAEGAPVAASDAPALPARAVAAPVIEGLAVLGLLLIAAALLLIDSGRRFPGWWVLLPTSGALLLIATPHAWLNRRVLGHRALVYVGLVSYPLYLWHWVLLTFARIADYGSEPPKLVRIAIIACSFLLAALTYHLLEKPIRFSTRRGQVSLPVVASVAICGLLGLLVQATHGAAFRYPPQIRPLAAASYDPRDSYYEAYRGGQCFLEARTTDFSALQSRCVEPPRGNAPLLVLWGDSHAASLYPGLRASEPQGGYRLAQFTASACPPMLGFEDKRRPHCQSFNDAVITQLRALKPAIVVLEAHWALYAGDGTDGLDVAALRRTVRQLESIGIPRVIVMGSLPSWKIYQPRATFEIWRLRHATVDRSTLFLDRAAFASDALVRAAVSHSGAVCVSPLQLLCNADGCLLSTDSRRPIPVALDNDHLSVAGSSLLVDLALRDILGRSASAQAASASIAQRTADGAVSAASADSGSR